MVTNTAKSNIKYTEIKTKQYKLWTLTYLLDEHEPCPAMP